MKKEAFVLAASLFLLVPPVADRVTKLLIAIWRLYDAYVRLGSATALIAQICLCAVVGSAYLPLLRAYTDRPKKREERECSIHHVKITETFPDLRALMPAFEQYIVMERFLPAAFQYRLLSMEDMEKVQKCEGRALKVAHLIDLLERKGPDCVARAISCFEVTREELLGHAELADILQRALDRHKGGKHTETLTPGSTDTPNRISDGVSLEKEIDDLAQKLKTDAETLTTLTEKLRTCKYIQT